MTRRHHPSRTKVNTAEASAIWHDAPERYIDGGWELGPDVSGRLIEWTGERCVPWLGQLGVVYEHLHRYAFAATMADGKDVLDIGCGEGYGAAIIAERARQVTGLELDPQTVAHARQAYRRPNLDFVQGSALDLTAIPDASVDLALCFEVIEHVREQAALIANARRVLRDTGILIISTPDRSRYRDGVEPNPFHVHELDRDEFRDLLKTEFGHVALWGQSAIVGSLLQAEHEGAGQPSFLSAELTSDQPRAREQPLSPVYLLAVAANAALPVGPVTSLLVDTEARDVFHESADLRREAATLREELEAMRATRGWRLLSGTRRFRDRLLGRTPTSGRPIGR